jgi:hypothetical protein
MRGGRRARGAAFAGELAFASRLGKREALATTQTTSAETSSKAASVFGVKPETSRASSPKITAPSACWPEFPGEASTTTSAPRSTGVGRGENRQSTHGSQQWIFCAIWRAMKDGCLLVADVRKLRFRGGAGCCQANDKKNSGPGLGGRTEGSTRRECGWIASITYRALAADTVQVPSKKRYASSLTSGSDSRSRSTPYEWPTDRSQAHAWPWGHNARCSG